MIVLLLVIGWYGNNYYKQNGIPFKKYIGIKSDSTGQLKCITKDGQVLYGKLPQGTECERIEKVKGSILVIPNKDFMSYKDNDKLNKLTTKYSCDGRMYCSQMRSCEEASFFLSNCPNTKMDGDNDGTPCEAQWCN